MAGYAAVKLGYEKLGFMGGIAVPSVVSYGAGYAAGANDAAKELNKRVSLSFGYAGMSAAKSGNKSYLDMSLIIK